MHPPAEPGYEPPTAEDLVLLGQRIEEAEAYLRMLKGIRDGRCVPTCMATWTKPRIESFFAGGRS